mmetsp:Transcript_27165/g.55376  ORF Transcript_27165/g.55376 Transcript_27165/m.55376 type:complete len:220 (+) Transcript_27165:620-1279(+)
MRRRWCSTSSTISGLLAMNSSLLMSIEACTSAEEVITPHLLADESFTMATPASSNSPVRASGVMKMLAPSTMSLLVGAPSASKKLRQLSPLTVLGRPPAGTKASALTLDHMVLRRSMPSLSTSVSSITPWAVSLLLSKEVIGNPSFTKRSSSVIFRPLGSSATPKPSAIPTTLQLSPYSRCMIRIKLPATSPSGPPVILTVKGSVLGLMPRERRRATSR